MTSVISYCLSSLQGSYRTPVRITRTPKRSLRVKGLGEDNREWDAWKAFQLSSLVLCIHVPFDMGSVPLMATLSGVLVKDLTISQIAWMHLVLAGCELIVLYTLIDDFSRRYLHRNQLCRCEISLESNIKGMMLAVILLGLSGGMSMVIPVDDATQGMIVLKEGDALARIIETLDAVMITPILEEMVYRGVVLSCLSTSLSIPQSLFLSTLMFALQHSSLNAFPVHVISGVIFGIGYLKTEKNLWTPILTHGLYNAAATLLLLCR